jgi:hypothetical protein
MSLLSLTTTDLPLNPQFFRYLPLHVKNRYAKGITVYISDDGILGLEAHFDNHSRMSDLRSGYALYFHFRPTEQIAYIWIRAALPQLTLTSALKVSRKSVRVSMC